MSPSVQRRAIPALVLLAGTFAGWHWFRAAASSFPAPVAIATAPARAPQPAPTAPVAPLSARNDRLRVAAEAARGLPSPPERAREFGRRLREWIARDPEAALAYVRALGGGTEYTQGLMMILPIVGQSDPDKALRLAAEMVSTHEQRMVYSALFAQMAAQPAVAAARLAQVPSGESRAFATRALADGWARSDLPAALAWAGALGGAEREPAMESVLATLMVTEPVRAVEIAARTLTGAALDRTLVAAAHTLARTDPLGATTLVDLMPAGQARTDAAFPVARALATVDPAGAAGWVKTLPAGQAQDQVLNNVLEIWAAKDAAAAAGFVAQMEPGSAQVVATAHLARLLAGQPAAALEWLGGLPHGPARDAAQVNFASAWAQHDPAAAAAWSAQLEASEARRPALQGALSYWLVRDPAAVRNFVTGLNANTQAAAAASVAPGLAQQDPSGALAWAQTLPAVEAREAAVSAAYSRWLANAPAAAKAWLAEANLSPDMKARLDRGP